MQVSVIILNYNRCQEVVALLGELKKQTYQDFEILVVDNASSDDSLGVISKKFPQVRLVPTGKNWGIGGFNWGMKEAKGDYLILLDSDMLPEENVVARLWEELKKSQSLGMACPAIYLQDGRYFGPAYDPKQKTKEGGYEILYFSGAVALRKDVFEKVGGYEERYFMCLDELEWATRVRLAGFKIQVFPEIKVWEMKAESGGEYRSRLGYLTTRNWIWYYARYLPLKFMGRFLKRHSHSVSYRISQQRSMKWKDVIGGAVIGFWGAPGFLKERKVLPKELVSQVERAVFGEMRMGWREGTSTKKT